MDAEWIRGVDYDDTNNENEDNVDEKYHYKDKDDKRIRKNSKNKKKSTQTRSTILPQIQERVIPIPPYMGKKNKSNKWNH